MSNNLSQLGDGRIEPEIAWQQLDLSILPEVIGRALLQQTVWQIKMQTMTPAGVGDGTRRVSRPKNARTTGNDLPTITKTTINEDTTLAPALKAGRNRMGVRAGGDCLIATREDFRLPECRRHTQGAETLGYGLLRINALYPVRAERTGFCPGLGAGWTELCCQKLTPMSQGDSIC